MTNRQRMLSVLQGQKPDRVPFVQYHRLTAPNEDVWSLIGRENFGIIRRSRVYTLQTPNCRIEPDNFERNGQRGYTSTLHTPMGFLTQEKLLEPTYGTAATSKHYVKDIKDYNVLNAYLRDIVVQEDLSGFLKDQKELTDDGVQMVFTQRTPFQQLWINWVSLEDLCLHMVDEPEVLAETIALLTDIQRRIFRAIRKAADKVFIPYVNIPDNITAPAIGVSNFRKYCLPLYQELSEMMAQKNVPVSVHTDGDLKPLWQAIGESGILALDSFSTPPDNDTSVAQAIAMWPKMRLLLNFPSSIHLADPQTVYEKATQILKEGGHTGRLWIQISENVPPFAWRKSFPEIVRAIHDFGQP